MKTVREEECHKLNEDLLFLDVVRGNGMGGSTVVELDDERLEYEPPPGNIENLQIGGKGDLPGSELYVRAFVDDLSPSDTAVLTIRLKNEDGSVMEEFEYTEPMDGEDTIKFRIYIDLKEECEDE